MRIKGKGKSILTRQRLPVLGSLFEGLLDQVSGAAAAYSVRLLRADYSGGLVRVRAFDGSSDQGEADVLPDSNNEISLSSSLTNRDSTAGSSGRDVSTLGELVDSGGSNYDGFVSEKDGQTTNGIDATQSAGASQAQIVSAGTLLNDLLKYDGADDFLETPQIYNNATALNISFWAKPTSTALSNAHFYISLGNDSYIQTIGSGDNRFRLISQGGQDVILDINNNAIAANTWVHISCNWDGSNMSIYINGNKQSTTANFSGTLRNYTNHRIGKGTGASTRYYEGELNDIIFYNRSLSDSEIQTIYNETKGFY